MFDGAEVRQYSGNDTKQKRTGAVYKFGGTYTRILNLLYQYALLREISWKVARSKRRLYTSRQ